MIILNRTGQAPLTFEGRLLAEHIGDPGGLSKRRPIDLRLRVRHKDHRRFEVAVYQRTSGGYVLAVRYRSSYAAEAPHDWAMTCTTPADLVAALVGDVAYDPMGCVLGYPKGMPHYDQKQARLAEEVRRKFSAQVAEVLRQIPETHERVS